MPKTPNAIQAADRRPFVYGVFVLLILVAASYLFWPRSPQPQSLVLTPESVRNEPAAADMGSSASAPIEDVALTGTTEPAVETSISEKPPEPKPAVVETPRTVTKDPTPAPAKSTSTLAQPSSSGSWVVNVGAFSSKASADKAQAEIARKGVSARVHEVTADGKTLWRVRVGYFASKAKAREYGGWMKSELGIEGWAGSR